MPFPNYSASANPKYLTPSEVREVMRRMWTLNEPILAYIYPTGEPFVPHDCLLVELVLQGWAAPEPILAYIHPTGKPVVDGFIHKRVAAGWLSLGSWLGLAQGDEFAAKASLGRLPKEARCRCAVQLNAHDHHPSSCHTQTWRGGSAGAPALLPRRPPPATRPASGWRAAWRVGAMRSSLCRRCRWRPTASALSTTWGRW